MKRSQSSPRSATSGPKKPPVDPPARPEPSPTDRTDGTWPFARFGWDILGVALLSIALVTLFGLVGFTGGTFLSPWVWLLSHWFGWGSYLAVAFVGFFGVLSLRRRFAPASNFRLGRILALEGWLFTVMTLLTVWGGGLLDRAESGLDGGLIGWGLLTLIQAYLPAPFSTLLLILLLVYFTLASVGVADLLGKYLEKWLLAAQESAARAEAAAESAAP
ncbi:MAG: hypothetical protein GYA59_08830, partial [Chloroflexi bacterium]|nr:hypothetical protein [Chloroflexota bacterium]